jgi:hypothetical protein
LFVDTSVTHNVEEVQDLTYIPTNPLEKSLFEEQDKFIYSALEHMLQTDMGKSIVHEHSFNFNAQEVFRKVVKHYTEPSSAKISLSTNLGYLTTAKYGSSWTGTAEGLFSIGRTNYAFTTTLFLPGSWQATPLATLSFGKCFWRPHRSHIHHQQGSVRFA